MLGAGVLSTLTFLLMCHSSKTLTDQDGMYLTGEALGHLAETFLKAGACFTQQVWHLEGEP